MVVVVLLLDVTIEEDLLLMGELLSVYLTSISSTLLTPALLYSYSAAEAGEGRGGGLVLYEGLAVGLLMVYIFEWTVLCSPGIYVSICLCLSLPSHRHHPVLVFHSFIQRKKERKKERKMVLFSRSPTNPSPTKSLH